MRRNYFLIPAITLLLSSCSGGVNPVGWGAEKKRAGLADGDIIEVSGKTISDSGCVINIPGAGISKRALELKIAYLRPMSPPADTGKQPTIIGGGKPAIFAEEARKENLGAGGWRVRIMCGVNTNHGLIPPERGLGRKEQINIDLAMPYPANGQDSVVYRLTQYDVPRPSFEVAIKSSRARGIVGQTVDTSATIQAEEGVAIWHNTGGLGSWEWRFKGRVKRVVLQMPNSQIIQAPAQGTSPWSVKPPLPMAAIPEPPNPAKPGQKLDP